MVCAERNTSEMPRESDYTSRLLEVVPTIEGEGSELMKSSLWATGASFIAVLLVTVNMATAQTKWASDGPVVHGHHHLNVTDRAAHERFWGDTLGGISTPWREVTIFKFPNALVFFSCYA